MSDRPRVAIVYTTPMSDRVSWIQEAMQRAKFDVVMLDVTHTGWQGLDIDAMWRDETRIWPNITQTQTIEFDAITPKPSPKRKALIAQLERARVRRDKNAVRDLTRQLETLRD